MSSLELTVGETSVPYGDRFQVTRKLSDTTDWSLSAREDLRELEPDAGGAYAGVFNERAYASDGTTYAKVLEVTGTDADGAAFTLPNGIPDGYSWQIRGGDIDGSFTWRGKGIASKLYRPRLSLPTVISTVSTPLYVRDVLQTIFDAYGITASVNGVSPNYLVPRMQMQDSSPIDWIRQLLEVTQAEWYEDEDTFVCFQPDWEGTGPVDFTYSTDELELRELSSEVSAVVEFANHLTCRRADDTGGVIGRADASGAAFGRQSAVTFDSPVPLQSLSWSKKLQLVGQLSDFYIYGPDGPPTPIDARELKAPAPPVTLGSMAHSVDFAFGAFTGGPIGATSGSYSIEFRGDTSGGIYADDVTSLIVENTASIESGAGRIQDVLGPNPLIADETTLQTWGERVLFKRSRQAVRVAATLWPANYSLRPGHVVEIDDVSKSQTYRVVVQEVTQSFGADEASRVTTFSGVQYVSLAS